MITRTNAQMVSGGGDITDTTPDNAKFKCNGTGYITLPYTINADYEVSVTFETTGFVSNMAVLGNTVARTSPYYLHLTEFSNKWYSSNGTSEINFGSYSDGEHTCIINKDNSIYFDGSVVSSYTPTTKDDTNMVLFRRGGESGYYTAIYSQYFKSFTIKKISTGETICNIVPKRFLVFGTFQFECLFDTISKTAYGNMGYIA